MSMTGERGFEATRAVDADCSAAVQHKSTEPDLEGQRASRRSRVGQATDIRTAVQRAGGAGAGGEDTEQVHEAAARGVSSGGGRLPHLDAIQRSFGSHDVSGVQAHVGGQAAEASAAMGAQAYATGNDVAFGRSPDLHTAAHEAAHVVQQREGVSLEDGVGRAGDPYERHADAVADRVVQGKSAVDLLDQMAAGGRSAPDGGVQRRELDPGQTAERRQDWTVQDRESRSQRWKDACLDNLMAGRSDEYTTIPQRRDFYLWFYEHSAALGYTTRWALAAHLVARGAGDIAYPITLGEWGGSATGAMGNELQGFMRQGNQVIFDNVFPKLRDLLRGGPLTGRAALQWDMQVLSEEQQLIQPLYAGVSAETRAQLEGIAKMQFYSVKAVNFVTGADDVDEGSHNREGDVPPFPANEAMTSVDARWRYGMRLGQQFAPENSPPSGYRDQDTLRPATSAEYEGTRSPALAAVDTRPKLHQLDAHISNIAYAQPEVVRTILEGLSEAEKAELARDTPPDGGRYSTSLSNMRRHVPRSTVLGALPTEGADREAFLRRYDGQR